MTVAGCVGGKAAMEAEKASQGKRVQRGGLNSFYCYLILVQ